MRIKIKLKNQFSLVNASQYLKLLAVKYLIICITLYLNSSYSLKF